MFLRRINRIKKLLNLILFAKSSVERMLQDIPISVKVTAWYTMFMTIIFVLVVAFAFKFSENFRMQAAAGALQKQVELAARRPDKFDEHEDDVYLSTYDHNATKLKGKLPSGFPQEAPLVPNKGVQKFRDNNKEYWYFDLPIIQPKGAPLIIRGVISVDKMNRKTDLFLLGLLLGLPIFIIVAALGGYKIIKHGFQPVRAISATAQDIGETNDLSQRIDIGPGHDEIHQMAASFNTMLAKVEDSVQREKRFSSDVSHELRTPVAVIMAESEYGRDCVTTAEEAREGFVSIHEQSQKMASLINQLLDLARLNNRKTIAKQTFDFSQMVAATCTDYQILAEAKQLILQTTLESQLTVQGNEVLLQRILSNYLDNALKFSKSIITVTLHKQAEKVLLCVADDGVGMDETALKRVWDRFYQTDVSRNKKSNSGLGLGLATVKAIAELHGGRVWAESTAKQGSKFYLEL